MKMTDGELLKRDERDRSEKGFAEPVWRHISPMYSAAARSTGPTQIP